MAVWLSGNALVFNEVALRRARLVPGWVTVLRQVNHIDAKLATQKIFIRAGRNMMLHIELIVHNHGYINAFIHSSMVHSEQRERRIKISRSHWVVSTYKVSRIQITHHQSTCLFAHATTPLHPYSLHALCGRLINFSSTCRDFPLNLVIKDRLVTWLLQSGMDYLLISDFDLQTPSENSPL